MEYAPLFTYAVAVVPQMLCTAQCQSMGYFSQMLCTAQVILLRVVRKYKSVHESLVILN